MTTQGSEYLESKYLATNYLAYASRVRGRVRDKVRVRVSVRSQERCVLFVCDRVRGSVRDGRVRVHGLDPGPLVLGFPSTWIPLI